MKKCHLIFLLAGLIFNGLVQAVILDEEDKNPPKSVVAKPKPREKSTAEIELEKAKKELAEIKSQKQEGKSAKQEVGQRQLTDSEQATLIRSELDKIGENNMILFKPQVSKYSVSIFTDIDCVFCRKLHSEIERYMAQGITVRYLFYPRAGKDSDAYHKALSV